MVLTHADHKCLVLDGIEILDALNEDIGGEKKTFDVIKDPNSKEVWSFWFRVKYNFCGDYFMLYPPKKNLEVNLRNHVNGLKYSKIWEDLKLFECMTSIQESMTILKLCVIF